MIFIDQEMPQDGAAIETLLDSAFGPERTLKPSYLLRKDTNPINELSTVVRVDDKLGGTVRFTPVHIRDTRSGSSQDCLLLGPLAVAPEFQALGLGSQLMRFTTAKAAELGYSTILLVGDVNYYNRFGFQRVIPRNIPLSCGRDADRLLVKQTEGALPLPLEGMVFPGWVSAPVRCIPAVA